MTLSLNEAKANLAKQIYMDQCIEYLQKSDVMDHYSNTMGRLRLTNELRAIKQYAKGDGYEFEAAYWRIKKIAKELNIPIYPEE